MKKYFLGLLGFIFGVSLICYANSKQSIKVKASELSYIPMDFSDIYYEDDIENYDYIHLLMKDSREFYNWLYSLDIYSSR
ncbi:MAG: hypothetical protein M0R05_01865 [Bacilli bacterium]|nr:hypothetical protein [Bacilli bacterium]MDD4077273.1 hypothetical protein [Bacilli bacterium]